MSRPIEPTELSKYTYDGVPLGLYLVLQLLCVGAAVVGVAAIAVVLQILVFVFTFLYRSL